MKKKYQTPYTEVECQTLNTHLLSNSPIGGVGSETDTPVTDGGAAKDHKYNIWQNWDEFDDDKKTRDHVFDRSLF